MIKVNVGMSRKVSKDYNSTGFSINLEGEIALSLDDPEIAVERIKEFYDLAEESLVQQIERYESVSAIAAHDEEVPFENRDQRLRVIPETQILNRTTTPSRNGKVIEQAPVSESRPQRNETTVSQTEIVPATNKQIQFLSTLGKRAGLSTKQLEELATKELGAVGGLYDLSKQQAGALITMLNQPSPALSSRR